MPRALRTVAERIRQQAESTPDAVAVVGRSESLSYRELQRRAGRIAHRLRNLGVGPEVRVGVCMEREPNLIAALLGILQAGGAYVALDPAYPPERLNWMIADAAPVLTLARSLVDEMLSGGDFGAPALNVHVDGENLAYVLYTSGSTGKPKGVAVRHRSVAALMDWAGETFDAAELSGVLAATSVCFDLSVFELFAPLSHGGRVILADRILELRHLPARDSVRLINTVPSAMAELLRLESVPASVGTVNLAGEPLRQGLVRQIREQTHARRVLNLYGPTEDTTYSTAAEVQAGEEPPIGTPLPGTTACILDRHMQLVPAGVAGELYLGGEGLARGYLGRPELTAERFIPDPYGQPGERLYRTGDICRQRAGGQLEYLGRADDQVKIRGYRIELGEIEAALASHAAVRQAAVVAADEPDGSGRRLLAYVAATGMGSEQLRNWLADRLPAYMVPSVFVPVDDLPVTASGKVDRKALAAMDAGEEEQERGDYQAPRTPVEQALAGIWAEVLGVGRVGLQDNFFALGGHSLRASQVISRVRRDLGVDLPLAELFVTPGLAELSRRVEGQLIANRHCAPEAPIAALGRGAAPLSFAQERVLFVEQLHPGTRAYHIPAGWRVGGKLDAELLERCLNKLIRRHEALRTGFEIRHGEPVQVVWPEAQLKLEGVEEAQRTFDLAEPPLLRAGLQRLAGDEHLFVLNVHHLVCDGWSLAVLLEELGQLYAEPDKELPPVAVSYRDYAAWQRQQRWDDGLRFWESRLAGYPGVLELPVETVRPARETLHGAQRWYGLPAGLGASLREAGRSEGTTEYMVLLAGFAALLHRYTGQGDLVVGTPAAGRARPELESTVGLFANTLALRIELGSQTTFADLLAHVRTRTLEALAHQHVPFEQVVQRLRPARDLSRNPIFQVMFGFEKTTERRFRLAGTELIPERIGTGSSKFDLHVEVQESADDLQFCWEFNSDLFSAATVDRMAGHFETLLTAVAADPNERVGRLLQMSDSESRRVLATSDASASFTSLPERIRQQAESTPDAVAVVGRSESLSYRELQRRAGRIAHRLRNLGVGPEVRVGVCMEREPNLIAALLGILQAGGAYVALDPAYPPERLNWMIADAAPVLTLARSLVDEMLSGGDFGAPALNVHVDGENLAYVLYTSGSTGKPKGVAVRHRSVAALMDWAGETFDAAELSGVLAATSVCFDLSVFELFAPLSHGGRVILADRILELRHLPARDSVRLINTVPSAMAELLRLESVPASVGTVNLAGEPLRQGLVRQIREQTHARRVLNLYGPTEDTTYSTAAEVQAGEEPPIGTPLPGTTACILDRHMQLVPAGVAGELYLGGEGLARGYLGRPELTAERFIPDPYGQPGERLYRTGDICRQRAGGQLEYLGRADDQVKIRGYRIELGEIEAALASHAAVRQAAVVAADEPDGSGRRLLAYVAATGMGSEQLRNWLADRLPAYMVPSVFVPVDDLPVTASGKVDRKALAAMDAGEEEQERGDYQAPRTPVEQALAGIWAEVLGVGRVGLQDNFFALGGHSLRASQVISRVRRDLGVDLPLAELFVTPGLAELSRRVEGQLIANRHCAPEAPIAALGRGAAPLSFAQERVLFVEQLHPGTRAYHIPAGWRVGGKLDAELLERCLNKLIRRHEALRTGFEIRHGEPVQVVWPEAQLKLEGVEEAQRTFDLAEPPLLRAGLQRLAGDEHLFVLNVHHLVCDGWSLAVLLEELGQLYAEPDKELPPVAVSYRDYAAWQRQQRWDDGLRFWESRLAGYPGVLELPVETVRPARETLHGAQRWYGLPAGLGASLREAGRSEGTTEYMVLLAGFAALLHRYTGQGDLVVGTPAAGRARPELESTVGLFANTLALRIELGSQTTFADLLAHVRTRTLEALAHQHVPFEQVVQRLRPARDLSRNPIFQVMFDLHDPADRDLRLAGLHCEAVPVDFDSSRVDLTVDVASGSGDLKCWVEYRTDLFSARRIERLIGDFVGMLSALTTSPDARVGEVSVKDGDIPQGRTAAAATQPATGVQPEAVAARQAQLTPERRALLQRRLLER